MNTYRYFKRRIKDRLIMPRKFVIFLGILAVVGMFGYFVPCTIVVKNPFIVLNASEVIVLSTTQRQRYVDSLTEPTVDTRANWKDKDQLLKSIGRLSFKKMTPSKLLLEDLYFTPSEHQDLSIYKDLVFSSVRCEDDGWLIVLLPSKPDSVADRKSIRETWGSVAQGKSWPWVRLDNMSIKVIFVIGVGGVLNESNFNNVFSKIALAKGNRKESATLNFTRLNSIGTKIWKSNEHIGNAEKSQTFSESFDSVRNKSWISTISQIQSEVEVFGDILLLNAVDTYRNLTRKILRSLKWTIENCGKAKYILKVDQDIFVNIPLIWTFLQYHGEKNSIYGHIYPTGLVLREGKWKVSKSALPIDRYPIYASGNAYILSIDAATKIVEMATHFPYVPVEDAFITGILASVTQVDRFSIAGFSHWLDPRPHSCEFVADKRYTGNSVDDYFKQAIWRDIHVKQALCK